MPLRIIDAIPIKVDPFLGPEFGFFALAETNSANPLPINPVIQQESQWCWAACVEMVMEASATPQVQCQVVTHFPGNKPAGDPCQDSNIFRDIGCAIPEMGEVWSSLNVKFELILKPAEPGQPALQFDALVNEITAGRPIEVGIKWHGGRGGHAMLVKGFGEIDGRRAVWINDPLGATTKFGPGVRGGEGQILFRDLREANGYGKWVCSWIKLTLNTPDTTNTTNPIEG